MSEPVSDKCFVISAIGDENTPIRESADLILHLLIEPAVKQCGVEAFRADHTHEAGSIISQMHNDIRNSAFCIAVLSNNPNVLYEIGFALAMKKLVIILKREHEKMPFDIQHIRTVHYTLEVSRLEEIKSRLIQTIENSRACGWRDPEMQTLLFGRQESVRTIRFSGGSIEEDCRLLTKKLQLYDETEKWRYTLRPGTIKISGEKAQLHYETHIQALDRDMEVAIDGEGMCQGDSIFIHYKVRSLRNDGIGWQGTKVLRGLEVAGNMFGCYMATNFSHEFEVSVGRFELYRER